MIRVGITGQQGFIGSHLYNCLGLENDVKRIPCPRETLHSEDALRDFVRKCDVIVHLAGINRHENPEALYQGNVDLARRLISAMDAENVAPHVLFSSSTQEESDNPYGAAKLECRRMFDKWAENCGGKFTGLVIPNVFGPFGKPNYNSVVATFCYKLTHGESPEIYQDNTIRLIYVNDLCREMIRIMRGEVVENPYFGPHGVEIKVSEILELLQLYKNIYFDQKIIPEVKNYFQQCLFNTFVCYIEPEDFYPVRLTPHADNRGSFVEVIKLDGTGGQVSFSNTVAGVTRGNHYHIRKFERFAVIRGKALIQLRRIGSDKVLDFEINADENPAFVDMPIWYTHNITNIGDSDVYTIFWINEFFDPDDPDTFHAEV
ncbi:MAG: NAD-dependent epimerase/dehydratase family protein [Desulfobacteraceae bacterium]|nr:NAD-dependent epimerase/dehydratase family protein [Desulfobacteraceae bacterium]